MSSKPNPKPKSKSKRVSLDDYCSNQHSTSKRDKRASDSPTVSVCQSLPKKKRVNHEVFVKNSRDRWQRTLVLMDWDCITMAGPSNLRGPSVDVERQAVEACDQLLVDIIALAHAHAATLMLSNVLFETLSAADRFSLPWQQWSHAQACTSTTVRQAMKQKEIYSWSKAFSYVVQAFADTVDNFAPNMDHKIIIIGRGPETAPVDRALLQTRTVHYVRCTPNHSTSVRQDELLFVKQKLLGLIYDKHESLEYVAFGLRKWRRKKLTPAAAAAQNRKSDAQHKKHETHPSLDSVTSLTSLSSCASRSSQCSSAKKSRKRICETELFS